MPTSAAGAGGNVLRAKERPLYGKCGQKPDGSVFQRKEEKIRNSKYR
jgi:hypothetical protein